MILKHKNSFTSLFWKNHFLLESKLMFLPQILKFCVSEKRREQRIQKENEEEEEEEGLKHTNMCVVNELVLLQHFSILGHWKCAPPPPCRSLLHPLCCRGDVTQLWFVILQCGFLYSGSYTWRVHREYNSSTLAVYFHLPDNLNTYDPDIVYVSFGSYSLIWCIPCIILNAP